MRAESRGEPWRYTDHYRVRGEAPGIRPKGGRPREAAPSGSLWVRPSRLRSNSAFARLRHGMRHVLERRTFLGTLAGGFLAAPLAAEAQQAGKVKRGGRLLSIVALQCAGKCWRWLHDL